ncbi:hypothetical protein J3A83DRAFT_4185822 [Scleroderma citrinum]
MFSHSDSDQHIYIVIPQYSLVATFDSGHSIETDLLAAGRTTHDQAVPPQNPFLPNSQKFSYNLVEQDVNMEPLLTTPKQPPGIDLPRTPGYPGRKHTTGTDSPLTPMSSEQSLPLSWPRYLPELTSPTLAHRKAANPEAVRRSERIAQKAPVSYNPPTPSPTGPVTPKHDPGNWKSTRIPDFVVALYKLPDLPVFPMTFTNEIPITTRIVLIVEIKPNVPWNPTQFQRLWSTQVRAQAQHAFAADENWNFSVSSWHMAVVGSMLFTVTDSERCDETYIPSPDLPSEWESDDPPVMPFVQSKNTISISWKSMELYTTPLDKCNPRPQTEFGPGYFDELLLLDPEGRSQKCLEENLQDLRQRNEDMWQ